MHGGVAERSQVKCKDCKAREDYSSDKSWINTYLCAIEYDKWELHSFKPVRNARVPNSMMPIWQCQICAARERSGLTETRRGKNA